MFFCVELQKFRKKKTKSRPVRTDEVGSESDTSFASIVSGGDEDDLEERQLKVLLVIYS